jgi:hypothetical protein
MDVQTLQVTPESATAALRQYKAHRDRYDRRDWEIERIYREIAKGRKVISAFESIRNAGVDERGRPRLALMRADQPSVICNYWYEREVVFRSDDFSRARDRYITVPWPGRPRRETPSARALAPRIPPQYRPASSELHKYHLLWEASWSDVPVDPILLKRLSRDAWIVLAAWDLTPVELAVMRGGL